MGLTRHDDILYLYSASGDPRDIGLYKVPYVGGGQLERISDWSLAPVQHAICAMQKYIASLTRPVMFPPILSKPIFVGSRHHSEARSNCTRSMMMESDDRGGKTLRFQLF